MEHVRPELIALDNPSVAFLGFLAKAYGLDKAVWQNTNFVVFQQLFDLAQGGSKLKFWVIVKFTLKLSLLILKLTYLTISFLSNPCSGRLAPRINSKTSGLHHRQRSTLALPNRSHSRPCSKTSSAGLRCWRSTDWRDSVDSERSNSQVEARVVEQQTVVVVFVALRAMEVVKSFCFDCWLLGNYF